MKEKSQIEKKAEARQAELLSAALGGASNAGGHWLNVSGKGFPRLYPQGVSASPFNALFMALHSDNNGCKTNLFTLYSETKARGAAVREHEQGVPFLFYNWNKYVNRNNPNETIDLSGRWNDSDSRLVSEEMIGDLLTSAWIPRYLKANDKRPVVVVGLVENKSHEHINSETFIKDVEKAIIRDGNIRLVVAGEKRNELRKERAEQQDYASPETTKKWGKELGADFILQGTINSIVDSYKKQKVVTYQIDLQLTNIETNEVVWMGDKKIKKQISDRVL